MMAMKICHAQVETNSFYFFHEFPKCKVLHQYCDSFAAERERNGMALHICECLLIYGHNTSANTIKCTTLVKVLEANVYKYSSPSMMLFGSIESVSLNQFPIGFMRYNFFSLLYLCSCDFCHLYLAKWMCVLGSKSHVYTKVERMELQWKLQWPVFIYVQSFVYLMAETARHRGIVL